MKRNMLHNATKKAAALLTAAVMVTAGTTPAWAASSYQEAEQTLSLIHIFWLIIFMCLPDIQMQKKAAL